MGGETKCRKNSPVVATGGDLNCKFTPPSLSRLKIFRNSRWPPPPQSATLLNQAEREREEKSCGQLFWGYRRGDKAKQVLF